MPVQLPLRGRCAFTVVLSALSFMIPVAHANSGADDPPATVSLLTIETKSAASVQTLFDTKPSIDSRLTHVGSSDQLDGAVIKIDAIDLMSGDLDDALGADQIAAWLTFLQVGGQLFAMLPDDDTEARILSVMPSDDVDDFSIVMASKSVSSEDWFEDWIQSLIDALDWLPLDIEIEDDDSDTDDDDDDVWWV